MINTSVNLLLTILFSGLIVSEISLPQHSYFIATKIRTCSTFGKSCVNSHSLSVTILFALFQLGPCFLGSWSSSLVRFSDLFLCFWNFEICINFSCFQIPSNVTPAFRNFLKNQIVFDLKICRSRMIFELLTIGGLKAGSSFNISYMSVSCMNGFGLQFPGFFSFHCEFSISSSQ